MNRRSFMKRVGAGLAGAYALASLPAAAVKALTAPQGFERITYKGIPLVFDEHCRSNRVYFVSQSAFKLVSHHPAAD
jgi:hypothetical protein